MLRRSPNPGRGREPGAEGERPGTHEVDVGRSGADRQVAKSHLIDKLTSVSVLCTVCTTSWTRRTNKQTIAFAKQLLEMCEGVLWVQEIPGVYVNPKPSSACYAGKCVSDGLS